MLPTTDLTTSGGEGLPCAISSTPRNAAAAAADLDFVTDPLAQQVAANNGQLLAGKDTSRGFADTVQADYSKLHKTSR